MKRTRTFRNLYPRRNLRLPCSHTPNGDGKRKGKNKTSSYPSPHAKGASSTMARHPTTTITSTPKPRPRRRRPRPPPLQTIPNVKNVKTRYGSGTCLFGRLRMPSRGSLMALGRSRGFICRRDAEIRCKARTWGVCSPPFPFAWVINGVV